MAGLEGLAYLLVQQLFGARGALGDGSSGDGGGGRGGHCEG